MGQLKLLITWGAAKTITVDYSQNSAREDELQKLTVKGLKEEIVKDFPEIRNAEISYMGNKLKDDDVIYDHYATNQSELVAKLVSLDTKPVKVTCNGETCVINVAIGVGLIKDLREAIAEQMGVPQSVQIIEMDKKVISEIKIGSKLVDELTQLSQIGLVEGKEITLKVADF